MTTDPTTILTTLRDLGFSAGDWVAYLGAPIPHCHYVKRVFDRQHQHVWLCCAHTAPHELVRIVFHVYAVPFNGRAKGNRKQLEERGAAPIHANGALHMEELLPWLGQRYGMLRIGKISA